MEKPTYSSIKYNRVNMSRKYFDKLMTGTGVTDKKVKSSLAESLMKKMGWTE